MLTYSALVSPPVALTLDVFARSLAEIGRADDDDLEASRPGLVASPRTGRNAHRVPLLEVDDLVVELHPAAPAQDHVHLLLLPVRVAVRKAIAGRDTLVAQAGLLELERLGRQAELKVRREVEPGAEVLQVLLEVPERERHGRNPMVAWRSAGVVEPWSLDRGTAEGRVDTATDREDSRKCLSGVPRSERPRGAQEGVVMTPAPPPSGELTAQISNTVVRALARTTGRGPTKAKTTLGHNGVFGVLPD